MAAVENDSTRKPICVVVVGMAGSGKTTFVDGLCSHLYSKKIPPYVVNLDPACHEISYPVNIGMNGCIRQMIRFL